MAIEQHVRGDLSEAQDRLEDESIAALLRRLLSEVGTLFRQETALAIAEVSGALTRLILGLTSAAAGAAVLYAGLLVLLAAAVLGLATVMSPWLAALLVGVATAVIGFVLLLAGKKALDPAALKPRRAAESLRQDKDVLTRSTT